MLDDPSQCACLTLRAAARRLTKRYDEALAPSGLSMAQFSILNVVAHDRSWGVAEIADVLDLDTSTVTRNLRPLASAGFIKMQAGTDDRRRRDVRITAKGRRTLGRAFGLWERAHRETLSTLGEQRSRRLFADLSAVH